MEDYKLRDLRASHTLGSVGWSSEDLSLFAVEQKKGESRG